MRIIVTDTVRFTYKHVHEVHNLGGIHISLLYPAVLGVNRNPLKIGEMVHRLVVIFEGGSGLKLDFFRGIRNNTVVSHEHRYIYSIHIVLTLGYLHRTVFYRFSVLKEKCPD